MSFFYNLNDKLNAIREKPEVTHKQLNERDMSRAAKGYEKYGKQGMQALAKAGREGKALDPVRKKYDKYDEGQDFGPGRQGPNKNQAGPDSFNPDSANYKTPNLDRMSDIKQRWEKDTGKQRGYDGFNGAADMDAQGQTKYVNRTAPGVINKIKDKLGLDMPDPAYGPKPDETQRLAKRYPAPAKSVDEGGEVINGVYKDLEIEPKRPQDAERKMTRGTRPAPKGDFMGTIKGGVWTADPPKPGEKGVPAPSGDPEGVKEGSKKLNFADKIANAKKEVDEMLGDVAAEAMRSALSPKQKKIDMNKNGKLDANDFAMLRKGAKPEMDEERSKGTAFDMSTRRVDTPKAGSTERGAKHDIKHSTSDPRYTGRTVTRRTDAQGISVGADDDSDAQDGPRGRGRPKGTKNVSSKAKVFQRKSKLMTKEGEDDPAEKGEYDREGDMALDDIDTIESAANELQSIIDAEDNLPEWVQSKINKAMDYLDTARDYMAAQGNDQEPIAEKAVSKQQQKFMGMARAMQKGEKIKGASKELKKVARTMKPKDTEDFAKTKHKGLPDKVKKKEVDENSEEGRITTTRTGPGKTLTTSSTGRVSTTIGNGKMSVKPGKSDKQMDDDTDTASVSNKETSPSKSGGMSYGKGIYDSMNRELEQMIAESMSINMSDSTEGNRSLTVTATDEDAMKLAMMLKSAGLGSQGGCGDVQEAVDENSPDYPTNTEQADNNFGYSGGLNKPKADVAGNGQSTVPVVATRPHNDDDLRRMMEMAGIKNEDNIDLGPTSPEVARMSKDEVNAALRSGMNSKVDLGPTSPDIARMSKDEVDAALRSGMSPDISNMDPDSVNAEFGKDSIQRMKEMAGIQEFSVKLDSPPRTGSYPDQLYGKDRERYDAVQTGSGPESQRVNQYYQNKPAGSYDSMSKHADQGAADYADRLNAVRAARIANNELTPGEWMQKGTNAVRKAFGGEDKPLKPAKTVVDLDGPDNSPAHRYVGSDEFNKRKYLDPKADAAYKARQKALFPDDFKEAKGDGNLANNAKPYHKVTQGDVITGRLGQDEKGGKEKQVEESIFALTNQWQAYKG